MSPLTAATGVISLACFLVGLIGWHLQEPITTGLFFALSFLWGMICLASSRISSP